MWKTLLFLATLMSDSVCNAAVHSQAQPGAAQPRQLSPSHSAARPAALLLAGRKQPSLQGARRTAATHTLALF